MREQSNKRRMASGRRQVNASKDRRKTERLTKKGRSGMRREEKKRGGNAKN